MTGRADLIHARRHPDRQVTGLPASESFMHYCGARKSHPTKCMHAQNSRPGPSSPAARLGPDSMYAPLLRIAAPVKAKNVASLQRLWLIFSNILYGLRPRFCWL
jgi:hypothetical protein